MRGLRQLLAETRFYRGENPREGPILLSQRRIFILPNRRGWGFAGVLLIQLLVATNYSNNLAFILSFLMVSIALLAILHGYRNLAGVELSAARSEPVFAGNAAPFEVYLSNPSRFPRIGIRIETEPAPPASAYVPPQTNTRIRLAVPALTRGWLRLPTVTVSSTFPLGLFRSWSPNNLKVHTLVYPKPAPEGRPFPQHPGTAGARIRDADDFRGFQAYQPGDPLRRIHWKGFAKGQGVHVKEYEDGSDGALILDFSLTAGSVEARLSQLCRWVLDAEQAGLRYAMRLPHLDVPSGLGIGHRNRCLEALALFPS